MNNHSPALKRAIASLVVNSTSTCRVVGVEPSVVPVCLTKRYLIAVLAGTIILSLPVAVATIVDKLEEGAVTVNSSVTEKFIVSLKVVVSFIVNVGTKAIIFTFYLLLIFVFVFVFLKYIKE
jgi:hypothetical protein